MVAYQIVVSTFAVVNYYYNGLIVVNQPIDEADKMEQKMLLWSGG